MAKTLCHSARPSTSAGLVPSFAVSARSTAATGLARKLGFVTFVMRVAHSPGTRRRVLGLGRFLSFHRIALRSSTRNCGNPTKLPGEHRRHSAIREPCKGLRRERRRLHHSIRRQCRVPAASGSRGGRGRGSFQRRIPPATSRTRPMDRGSSENRLLKLSSSLDLRRLPINLSLPEILSHFNRRRRPFLARSPLPCLSTCETRLAKTQRLRGGSAAGLTLHRLSCHGWSLSKVRAAAVSCRRHASAGGSCQGRFSCRHLQVHHCEHNRTHSTDRRRFNLCGLHVA